MLREKVKETNMSSSNKWHVSNKMPIVHIRSLTVHAPLCKITSKKVNNLSMNKEVCQF